MANVEDIFHALMVAGTGTGDLAAACLLVPPEVRRRLLDYLQDAFIVGHGSRRSCGSLLWQRKCGGSCVFELSLQIVLDELRTPLTKILLKFK